MKRFETTLNANVGSENFYVPIIRNFLDLVVSHSVNELYQILTFALASVASMMFLWEQS